MLQSTNRKHVAVEERGTALPSHLPSPTHSEPQGTDLSTPLCVDLDGTLVKSDTLVDSTLALARQHPSLLLKLPGWLVQGRAALKRHITASVELDVVHLPYNLPLLSFLKQQHASGRPIYLATAADAVLAQRVADHLGLFRGVLASDGSTNLAGSNKLAAFRERFGDRFCYIGNASADLPVLSACVQPMAANPTKGLRSGIRSSGIPLHHTFLQTTPTLKAWIKAIRLHQWAKNVLLFLPLLLAHARSLGLLAGATVAFLAFGLCASATYIINDLLDIEADRIHPRKRRRPFASGDLSAIHGVGVVVLFFLASFALAFAVPHVIAAISPALALAHPYNFMEWLVFYTVTTLAYSLRFKSALLIDVIVLSGLYTVRILAGSSATGIAVSTWLAGFSIFFFLSLAFVKRFSELENLRARGSNTSKGRGYHVKDIEQLRSFGSSSAYASVVVFTLYISNLSNATELYRHNNRLWLLVPVLLLWLSRLWLLASRGQLDEDPVVFAITDKRSLALGAVVVAIVLSAL
ncbi:MAG: UbiA family prenyltransferase [Acidobacteriaceae bacterium]